MKKKNKRKIATRTQVVWNAKTKRNNNNNNKFNLYSAYTIKMYTYYEKKKKTGKLQWEHKWSEMRKQNETIIIISLIYVAPMQ